MSYETSSEFQIRYLLKSVAVYLLFMRRIASISMLAVVSALSASAATVLFDFNSSLLPETPAKTVSVTDSGSGFVATLATASSSANLGSASSAASGDWVSSGTSFDTQGLDSFMENQISFGNSWQTFISGPKGASLSLTISGLVAGASYQIALVTGCPLEGAGAWNSLVTSNTYGSADPSIGANSQTIQARTPTKRRQLPILHAMVRGRMDNQRGTNGQGNLRSVESAFVDRQIPRFTEFPPVHQFTQGAAGAGSRLSGFIRVAVRLCK